MKTYFIFLCLLISGGLASATTQTTANQDKPCLLYIKSYSESRSSAFVGLIDDYYFYSDSNHYDYEYYNEQETLNEWIHYNDGQSGSAFCQQNISYDSYEHILGGDYFDDYTNTANVTSGLTIANGVQIITTSVGSWNIAERANSTPPISSSTNYAVPTLTTTYTGIGVRIQNEYCNIQAPIVDLSYSETNYYNVNYKETYNRKAQIQYKLKTGGKATSKLRQLYGVGSVGASSYTPIKVGPGYQSSYSIGDAWGDSWPSSFSPLDYPDTALNFITGYYAYANPSPVLPQNISIGSYGAANANGIKYLILPDNADVDVTPYVAGMDYYTFNLDQPKKYHSYFDVFVDQPNPGTQITLSDYTGHAFWQFKTDAPADALQYIATSLTSFLNTSWGFYPHGADCGLIGQLQNDSIGNGNHGAGHSYSVKRVFYIGFDDLISGLQFARGISNAPPEYCYRSYSCVGATQDAGRNVGITLPSVIILDLFPQNFGADILKQFPGPFVDDTLRYSK
jgi:hypothetical protein